jgi:hypothetical protein
MNDIIIWLLILFVFLIIAGLYLSEFTPQDLSDKQKILNLKINNVVEYFSPSTSDSTQQTEGASQLFNWGLPDDTQNNPPKCHHQCTNICPPICPHKCQPLPIIHPTPCPTTPCPTPCPTQQCNEKKTCVESPKINMNKYCTFCDITLNKDIDKYVLKSSVPPCPDMSDYITKNMVNPNIDPNNYILKSEIKPCHKIDVSKYILKSEIPPCPTCPICPECPICPICPQYQQNKCKEIYDYKITDHPDIDKYIRKDEINKYINNSQNINNSNQNTNNGSQNFNQNTNNGNQNTNNGSQSFNQNTNNGNQNTNNGSQSFNQNTNNGNQNFNQNTNNGNQNFNQNTNNNSKNINNGIQKNIGNQNIGKNFLKEEGRPDLNNYQLDNLLFNNDMQHNSNLLGYYAGDSLFAGV